jgi:hypothetical protein
MQSRLERIIEKSPDAFRDADIKVCSKRYNQCGNRYNGRYCIEKILVELGLLGKNMPDCLSGIFRKILWS